MSDAREIARKAFDRIADQYPAALSKLELRDSAVVRRLYFYGVLKTILRTPIEDQYAQMHLIALIRHEVEMSSEDLAYEILIATEEM